MDLRQLRYFVCIVERESMTAAAETLHIAQPSLSQHVANLERELGVKLFLRGPGGVKPTHSGILLYRHAKSILRQTQQARAAILHGRDVPAGRVSVGLPTSTSRMLAMPVIDAVKQAFPEVMLEIIEGSSSDLAEAVARHRLDMAVAMNAPSQREGMQTTPLLVEDLLLVGPPLGEASVTIEQVSQLSLVLPSFPNSIRVLTERVFGEEGLQLRLLAETSAVSVLLDLVSAGRGWTILPSSTLAGRRRPGDNVVGMRIMGCDFSRRLSLCLSETAENNLACVAVHGKVIEVAHRLVASGHWPDVTLVDTPTEPEALLF